MWQELPGNSSRGPSASSTFPKPDIGSKNLFLPNLLQLHDKLVYCSLRQSFQDHRLQKLASWDLNPVQMLLFDFYMHHQHEFGNLRLDP